MSPRAEVWLLCGMLAVLVVALLVGPCVGIVEDQTVDARWVR